MAFLGRSRSQIAAVAVAIGACAVALFTAGASGAANGPDSGPSGVSLDRVFIIMLENHSQAGVVGDPAAPYITSLASTYAQATQYYGVTHPSEPNYIAATSGSNWWVNNDNPANRFDHTSIVDQLSSHHISWAAYMEAAPSAGYTGDFWPSSSTPLYASKHNPFVLYPSVRNNPEALNQVKPYSSLAGDLNSEHAPRYVWITPDQCNDMHGGIYATVTGFSETPCPYSNVPGDANDESLKAKADAFVKTAVQTIMSSRAWTDQSAIFIVADEGDYNNTAVNGGWASPAGCCDSPLAPAHDPDINAAWPGGTYGGAVVPAIVIAPGGPHQYTSSVAYNHYSLLRTIEDAWGLSELGFTSDHAQVSTMNEFLKAHNED